MRSRAARLLICGLAALPAAGQELREQVVILVPEAVVFPVMNLAAKAAATPSLVTFNHAFLAPGSRLRISVRAETLDLAANTPARISYAAHAQGGIAFSGSLRDTDFSPVFEGEPLTSSGSVEIAWTLEPLGRVGRSGNRGVTLRWKVESISAGRRTPEARHSSADPAAAPPPGYPGDERGRPQGNRGRRDRPLVPRPRRSASSRSGAPGILSSLG
ncbi:MAG TPA: hypothetical protein VGS07_08945 [Thermoanaerobaculia bacterium]|jgi:hypothetical protein|nr:hypothetical protein [Thermoanaerobaculia bacterium]